MDGSRLAGDGTGTPRRRWVGPALAIGLLAAALGAAGLVARAWLERRAPPPGPPSVAVLPFADLSPARDQGFFAEGLAEEILTALSQVDGLRVIGRTSALAFRGKATDLRAIGDALHVGTVLEGSVRKEGTRLRVAAQLLKVPEGHRIWSRTFDRELVGVFAIQEEIASAVVEALRVDLLARQESFTRDRRTAHPEAYTQYLLGRQQARDDRADAQRAAAAAYERALAVDPGYAPAWAGLALAVYWGWANVGETAAEMAEAQRRALVTAERAVELAPDLADGYAARGFLRASITWDWAGARADLERAAAASPRDAEIQRQLARDVLLPLGHLPEAVAAARRACDLDPLSATAWSTLSAIQLAARELPLARAAAARSLELAPAQDFAPTYVAIADLLEGRPADALRAAGRSTEELFRLQLQAMALHDLGDAPAAARALADLETRHGQDAAFQIAEVHAWRGDREAAFRWLERAVAQRDGGLIDLKTDPLLGRLRGDPRLAGVARALRLPEP